MIKLHPQLENDCILLGEFSLCSLLLVNDANYPWFILLPNRAEIQEMHHLTAKDQQQLLVESMYFSRFLEQVFQPDKINIASLGNVVPQLHVHHIARFTTDACWPAPIWGNSSPAAYQEKQVKNIKNQLFTWFKDNPGQAFHCTGTTAE